jgi:hypothetical protein
VGENDGSRLGCDEGEVDSDIDGNKDGFEDGDALGFSVIVADGENDGDVDENDGSRLGCDE